MQDTAKAVLVGKFRALDMYITKEERSKSNNLGFHLGKLYEEHQFKT